MMTFFKYWSSLLLLLCSAALLSQNDNRKWYFGHYAGLDFATSPPTVLTNGAMNTIEGCATVSDANGNLLFYTDGITVYNKQHAVMQNGTGLSGYFSSAQAAVVVRLPGSTTKYYVFTQGAHLSGLQYSIVDMSLAGGMGVVLIKNVLLYSPSAEMLTTVRHCNGVDVWILSHSNLGSQFWAYKLTSSGVGSAVISAVGAGYVSGNLTGCMKLSPNGKRLAVAFAGPQSGFEVYDFNPSTGIVSNPLLLGSGFYSAYGMAFSPDGSKLYGTRLLGKDIYQWDLCAGSAAAVVASKFQLCSSGADKGQLQLANDGKIYVARNSQYELGVIQNPNAAGFFCNYVEMGMSIAPGQCDVGLPNFTERAWPPTPPPYTYTVNNCLSVSFTAPAFIQPQQGCTASDYSVDGIKWLFGDPASGAANTSTLTNPTHTFTGLGTYTAQLIIFYSCGGATDTIKKQITLGQHCISVSSTSISCAGLGSATVHATNGAGPFSYTWMPGAQTGSVATGLGPGVYTVTVFDASVNSSSSATVMLTSATVFSAGVLAGGVSCYGAATGTAVVAALSGGSGSQTYVWTNGNTTYTTPAPAGMSPGMWTVTITDAVSGCQLKYPFLMPQPPPIVLKITASPQTGCLGKPVILHGSASGGAAGYTYTWSTGVSTRSLQVQSDTVGTYIYTLQTTDAKGCIKSNTVAVSYIEDPHVTVRSVSICPSKTGTLVASGALYYLWNNGTDSDTLCDHPSSSRGYTVVGSTQGCTASATASIILKPMAVAAMTSNDPVCEGRALLLLAAQSDNYSWSGPQGFTSTLRDPVIPAATEANNGVYKLSTTVNGCEASASRTIVVRPSPHAGFMMTPLTPVEDADEVIFTNTSNGAEYSDWFIKDNGMIYSSTSVHNSHLFENAGTYPVVLVVRNNNGCEDTVIHTIRIEPDFSVYVPNAFTPNTDGRNEQFLPVTRGVKSFAFVVFDRWGEKLFSTNDPVSGWDGSYRGAPCKQDVYCWKLSVLAHNGDRKDLSGIVTLLR